MRWLGVLVVGAVVLACGGQGPVPVDAQGQAADATAEVAAADLAPSPDTAAAADTPADLPPAPTKQDCLEVVGSLDFGGVVQGKPSKRTVKLRNCGPVELYVFAIKLKPDDVGAFDLDASPLIGMDNPVILGVEGGGSGLPASMTLSVTYHPLWLGGPSAMEKSAIHLDTSAGPRVLPVQAYTLWNACPNGATGWASAITLPVGATHTFQDQVELPPGVPSPTYAWTLPEKPAGSKAGFQPSASVAEPTLTLDAAGTYQACLAVDGGKDVWVCAPGCRYLVAE